MAPETLSEALPHADEAERAVLGAILLDNEQFEKAQEILRPDSFYSSRHESLFRVIETMIDQGKAP